MKETRKRPHPLYQTHSAMKQRCTNPNIAHYANYGGRGIKLDPSFYKFADFLAYVEKELGPRPEGYQLDRIDNNGNYEPGNLRWASRSTQVQNRGKRRNHECATQYIGVVEDRKKSPKKPYKAQIFINGKSYHLKYW